MNEPTQKQGLRSFLTETRVGSTTPLGCVIQSLLTGLAAALVMLALMMWMV
jgi:hypothetical protein